MQVNQSFLPQGPAPSFGPLNTVQSGDAPPNGNVSGAIEAVIADPNNANRFFVATPNGGIWGTTNGGATWTALTDHQATLSIASLAFDQTDPNHNTLIAGTGLSSNGTVCGNGNATCFYNGSGGIKNGILYSKDGGATWSSLGAAALGGQTVNAVAAVGNTLLAGTFETSFAASAAQRRLGGLYRSPDGGATFTLVSGTGGLPVGPVSSIAVDPGNSNRIYAAVSSPNAGANANTAVYVSNNGGVNWTPVFQAGQAAGTINAGSQTVLKIASAPGGAIAVGVVDFATNAVTGLFYSGNAGASWTALAVPTLNNGNQAPTNFAIAIDPNHTNQVYVSGDRIAGPPFTVTAYRIDALGAPGTATSITDGNTANGSTAHADSRSIAFDASGRLILTSDGGIYARTNPQTNGGAWSSLIGNMGLFAPSSAVAYDAVGKRLMTAAQDTGVTIQSAPNSLFYKATNGADGINAFINDVTLAGAKQTAFYGNTQQLGTMMRMVLDRQGNQISPNTAAFGFGAAVTCNGGFDCAAQVAGAWFSSPWVNNRVDPTRMAIGGTDVYVTQDTLSGAQGPTAAAVDLTLTDLGSTPGASTVGTIAYGTRDNVNMLVAGTFTGLAQSTTGLPGSLVAVPAYAAAGGASPLGVVLDPRSQNRYYVADLSNLYGTTNQGASFANLTSNLPAGIIRPMALDFISNNGVNALLVGGINNVANAQSTIAVADSDALGALANWRPFGNGLPNTQVSALRYNAAADVLAVGTFGHGLFALYDVTSYFPQATVLQFGLANNDSIPDASFLTNGTSASRPLIKYGSGTLTIAGNATYTGGTTINGGTTVIGNGGTTGSILGNVTFCSNPGDQLCDASTNKVLAFNRSNDVTFTGTISGPGQLTQQGGGRLTLTANNSYTGATTVNGGILDVEGSLNGTSSVTVNTGAALTGAGTIDPLLVSIATGGTLAPGNGSPASSMAIVGNLAFQSGAIYLIQLNPTTASLANVTGNATLGGAIVNAGFANGTYVSKKYTILTAGGGVSGTFAGPVNTNLPGGFTTSLSYDANNAYLNLVLAFANPGVLNIPGGLNGNQQAVGNALTNYFSTNGTIPIVYGALSATGLTQASGEHATGSQQTTFDAMGMFTSLLTDPFMQREGGTSTTPDRHSFADAGGEPLGYAGTDRKRLAAERDAYAMFTKAPLRGVYQPRWSVWAAGFGGSQSTDGNTLVGSNAATSRIFGTAVGADYLLAPTTIAGFALAGGGTNFSVNNLGSGRSDLFQAGAYVRHLNGPAYISAALAYGWQDVTTDRTVTIAGSDRLRAEFNANAVSGRAEGGYRFVGPWSGGVGLTPYAAAQFTTFALPSYAENVISGAATFALAYGAKTVTDTRTELGLRSDKSFAMPNGVLTLRGRLAWAHDFNPSRAIAATFQALPGASFVVSGAAQAPDSALTTASAEMKWLSGWSAAATFEGEFSNVTRSYAGKGLVRYAW